MTGRYKAYPEYKDSGVEWLKEMPVHWKLLKAKHIFKKVQRPVRPEDGIVTAFRDGEVTLRSNRRTDGFTNAAKEIGYQGVRKGDLLVHAMDGFAGAIGISDSNGKCSPVCSVCTPWQLSRINSKYYGYLVRQLAVTDYITSLAKGIRERSTEFRFNEFSSLFLAMPPKVEQQKIANFLDHETAKIDTLIAKQEKLIELLKEKRQAVISHAVTKGLNPNAPMRDSGVEWLGEVPEHWSVKKLSSSSKITRLAGYEYTAYWKATESGEIIAIRGQNIRFNKLIELNKAERISSSLSERLWRSKLSRNDIAYPCVGTIGNAVLIEEDDKYHINQNIAKLTPTDRVHPLFLTYFLNSKVCLESALFLNTSDAQPSVLVGNLRRVKIAIPQREEQILISKYLQQQLKKLEDINDKTLLTINLMKERKTALISAAVTGKIDVRDFVSEQGQPQGV